MWHIGEDIPFIPNKRRGGVVLGGLVAPIFFNTTEDSGGLPLKVDVTGLKTGESIILDSEGAKSRTTDGEAARPSSTQTARPCGTNSAPAGG